MSSGFRVVAIIAAHNEADIIGPVVRDLIGQGLDVYFLDDRSNDDTVALVETCVGAGVIAIERLAETFGTESHVTFEWERILQRKADIAANIEAHWFIHHDADEFRESPWRHMSLKEAIARVDALGFNAIDFRSFDFWPTHDRFQAGDDVREAFSRYAQSAPYDRVQVRCWKKTASPVDLASSGGHDVRFPGRKVFPVRFISRHYPIRSDEQGRRKVFEQRRFVGGERERGWHVQYDGVRPDTSFIRDPSTLVAYDPDAVRIDLAVGHRGVEALEAAVADLQADLESQRRETEWRDAELERLEADIQRRDEELERKTVEIERRGAEIDRWRAALADASRRIEGFRESLSWRWTAPLRALLQLIHRSR